jgi:hypothetical protein
VRDDEALRESLPSEPAPRPPPRPLDDDEDDDEDDFVGVVADAPSDPPSDPPAPAFSLDEPSVDDELSLAPGEDPSADPAEPSAPAAVAAALLDGTAVRSFLAQPEPLKWTAGALNALRIWPPQTVQTLGPSASIRWMISTRWPHDRQT